MLLRAANRNDSQHSAARRAIVLLGSEGFTLHYTQQNIAEFWNAMTRPRERNGYGLDLQRVDHEVAMIEAAMTLLPDDADVYRQWRRLVVEHRVSGVQVHDARLAAAVAVHQVTHLLTFNVRDFERYANCSLLNPDYL